MPVYRRIAGYSRHRCKHGPPGYLSHRKWNHGALLRVAAMITRIACQRSVMSMRVKTSSLLFTSVLKLLGHSMMGIAVGLAFAFVLTRFDPLGIIAQINNNAVPGLTPAILTDTIVLSFAVGATLTGLVFMLTEDR